MARLDAPWTPEQVAALNRWQTAGCVHPFTCGNDRTDEAHKTYAANVGEAPGMLIATTEGWLCGACDYRQTWAHDFMLDLPPDPLASLFAARAESGPNAEASDETT